VQGGVFGEAGGTSTSRETINIYGSVTGDVDGGAGGATIAVGTSSNKTAKVFGSILGGELVDSVTIYGTVTGNVETFAQTDAVTVQATGVVGGSILLGDGGTSSAREMATVYGLVTGDVDGGAGGATIAVGTSSNKTATVGGDILGGEQTDYIYVYGSAGKDVNTKAGNDFVYIYGGVNGDVYGGLGADRMYIGQATNYASASVWNVHGDDGAPDNGGDDSIYVYGTVNQDVFGNGGRDAITVYNSGKALGGVFGEAGGTSTSRETINIYGSVTGDVDGGAGGATIAVGTSSNKTAKVFGSILGGELIDAVTVYGTVAGPISTGAGNDVVTFYDAAPAGSFVMTLDAGTGTADRVNVYYSSLSVSGTPASGAATYGNDELRWSNAETVYVYGTANADSITIDAGAAVTAIDALAGNDTIVNRGTVTGNITGNAGNDTVTTYAGSQAAYIYGGEGNDVVYYLGGRITGRIEGDNPTTSPGDTIRLANGYSAISGTGTSGTATYPGVGAISYREFEMRQFVNSAPELDADGNPTLTAILEDTSSTDNQGTIVSDLLATMAPDGGITDFNGDVAGIAVIGADNSHGTWQYNIGSGWKNFGAPSENATRLLSPSASIRFLPDLNFNGTAEITFRAWDQTGGVNGNTINLNTTGVGGTTAFSAQSETATITVNPVNDAPTASDVTVPAFDEDPAAPVGIVLSGDPGPDNEHGQTLTFVIGDLTALNGKLYRDAAMTDELTVGEELTLGTTGPGTVTVYYLPTADFNGPASFEYAVRDSGHGTTPDHNLSADATVTLSIIPVNDAPAAVDVTVPAFNEDPTAPVSVVLIGDPGPDNEHYQTLTFVIGDLTTLNGKLYRDAAMTDELTSGEELALGTAGPGTVTVYYMPTADFYGAASFMYAVRDSGPGTTPDHNLSADATVSLTVNPVNDAPTASDVTAPAFDEDPAAPVGIVLSGDPGPDNEHDQTLTFVIGDLTALNGKLYRDEAMTDELTSGEELALGTAGPGTVTVYYMPTADFNGTASFKYTVRDDGGTANGGADEDATPATVTLTVNPVNDAPTVTVPVAQIMNEDSTLTITGITVADIDAMEGTGLIQVTVSASHGALGLSSLTGITIVGGANNTGLVQFQGSPVDVQAALAALQYTPTPDFFGNDEVIVEVNDLGNTGSSGPLTATGRIPVFVVDVPEPVVIDPDAAGNSQSMMSGAPPDGAPHSSVTPTTWKVTPEAVESEATRLVDMGTATPSNGAGAGGGSESAAPEPEGSSPTGASGLSAPVALLASHDPDAPLALVFNMDEITLADLLSPAILPMQGERDSLDMLTGLENYYEGVKAGGALVFNLNEIRAMDILNI
jgi:hypothetical protein